MDPRHAFELLSLVGYAQTDAAVAHLAAKSPLEGFLDLIEPEFLPEAFVHAPQTTDASWEHLLDVLPLTSGAAKLVAGSADFTDRLRITLSDKMFRAALAKQTEGNAAFAEQYGRTKFVRKLIASGRNDAVSRLFETFSAGDRPSIRVEDYERAQSGIRLVERSLSTGSYPDLYRQSRDLSVEPSTVAVLLKTYIDFKLSITHKISGDTVDLGRQLLEWPEFRALLGHAWVGTIASQLASALIRTNRNQDAIQLLHDWSHAEVPRAATRLVDALVVSQPLKALVLLDGQLRAQRSVDAREITLRAELAQQVGRDSADLDRISLDDYPDRLDRANLLVARSNRLVREGRACDALPIMPAFFELYGLSSPRVGIGSPFRIDRIVNTVRRQEREGPLVTVITTCFESQRTVTHAIESLLAQTYSNFELFVVDDGSRDGTRDRLVALSQSDPRIKLIFNETNVGTYAAKNTAIALSSGEFVTFHDSDDWAHPQRLERHVAAMRDHPKAVASRSRWLRIDREGVFILQRGSKRYIHYNPASVMIRHCALHETGPFDTARAAADTELLTRFTTRYGARRILDLDEPLGLGLSHERSLTRSGAATFDREDYSEVRERYRRSWLAWHRSHPDVSTLTLTEGRRHFAVPDALSVTIETADRKPVSVLQFTPVRKDQAGPAARPARDDVVYVGISLASSSAGRWEHTCRMLEGTLTSVLNQTDGRFQVLLCCHDVPRIAALADERIEVLLCDTPRPDDSRGFRKDKKRKGRIIAARLRALGGGYLLPLDADDYLHEGLVGHVLADDNRRGYAIRTGYALDWQNGHLAPLPGAWQATFDAVCGSSGVFHFGPDDLPASPDDRGESNFDLLLRHAYSRVVAEELGRPLDDVPFPAAIYVVNHSQNMSFSLQRTEVRRSTIVSNIRSHRIPVTDRLISEFNMRSYFETKPGMQSRQ